MDKTLLAELTLVANAVRAEHPRVTAWIGQMIHYKIRDDRPRRKRGTRVRLARNNREMVIDADKVREAERVRR